jgi:hypothetical protein
MIYGKAQGVHNIEWAEPVASKLQRNRWFEFEKQSPVEVGDFRAVTDHFRGIYRIYIK